MINPTHKPHRTPAKLFIVGILFVLIVAACGSSETGQNSTAPTPQAQTTTATTQSTTTTTTPPTTQTTTTTTTTTTSTTTPRYLTDPASPAHPQARFLAEMPCDILESLIIFNLASIDVAGEHKNADSSGVSRIYKTPVFNTDKCHAHIIGNQRSIIVIVPPPADPTDISFEIGACELIKLYSKGYPIFDYIERISIGDTNIFCILAVGLGTE